MTQAFNLSQLANFVNTSGQLNAATGLFNQVPVANGGTGKSSVTTGALLLGAGTSAMTELTGTTPGTTVVSSPTGWTAAPSASVGGGDYIMRTYTSPSAWTKPASLKAVRVTVVGGGGTGGNATSNPTQGAQGGGGGGGGGAAICYLDAPAIPGPITITAGAGTNSFGPLASATGGANGGNSSGPTTGAGGAGGIGTVPSPAPSGAITLTGSPGVSGSGSFLGSTSYFGGTSQIFSSLRLLASGPNAPGAPSTSIGTGGNGAGTRGSPPVGTNTGGTGGPGIVIIEEFY